MRNCLFVHLFRVEVNAMSSQHDQSKTIRDYLLSAMTEGEYANCDRLPRESILSEKLGISRTQLRDILAALEREGFITRRHGVGTLINHYVLNAQTRMDIEVEFLDMIRQSGFTPAVASVQVSEGAADARIASQLQVEAGAPIIRVARLCTADEKPAIYCEDVIAKSLIKSEYTIKDLQFPIFHFLQQFCGVSAYQDLTDLKPIVADSVLSELLQIPVGSPLLFMDEVDYDIDGNPVFCSKEYFADGIFRHTVLRKKL